MSSKDIRGVAKGARQFIEDFFGSATETDRQLVPSVLRSAGKWMAMYDESMLGIFCLDESEQQRVMQYREEGWHLFPGFMVSEGKRPNNTQIAMSVLGSCNFFSSNHTSNLIAFEVGPSSSLTVVDHFHEIKDSSGREHKYRIALAFVLGISQGEQWPDVKRRLSELLNHSMEVWRKLG